MPRRVLALPLFLVAFGVAAFGVAGEPKPVASPASAPSEAYGGEIQQRMIPITEFVPARSGYVFDTIFSSHLHPDAAGTQHWYAPLDLPTGAAIQEIRVLVQDDDPAEDIQARLSFMARSIDGSDSCDDVYYLGNWAESSAGLSGPGVIVLQHDPPHVIRTQDFFPTGFCSTENYLLYSIWVELRSQDHFLSGVVVRWRRTVSDAPSSATFGDVPTSHPFFQFVEALAQSGITVGCGGGNFCPDTPLTRGQMAVFLAKALGLHWPI